MKLNEGSKGNNAICKPKLGATLFLMTKAFSSKKGVERSPLPDFSLLTFFITKFKTQFSAKEHHHI